MTNKIKWKMNNLVFHDEIKFMN